MGRPSRPPALDPRSATPQPRSHQLSSSLTDIKGSRQRIHKWWCRVRARHMKVSHARCFRRQNVVAKRSRETKNIDISPQANSVSLDSVDAWTYGVDLLPLMCTKTKFLRPRPKPIFLVSDRSCSKTNGFRPHHCSLPNDDNLYLL